MKLFDSILLFGSLAMLIMFADQLVYKGVPFFQCSFFLFFGIAGFFYYIYRRGLRIMQQNEEQKSGEKTQQNKKKGDRKN